MVFGGVLRCVTARFVEFVGGGPEGVLEHRMEMLQVVDELLFQRGQVTFVLVGVGEDVGDGVERVGQVNDGAGRQDGGAEWPGCLSAGCGAGFASVDAVADPASVVKTVRAQQGNGGFRVADATSLRGHSGTLLAGEDVCLRLSKLGFRGRPEQWCEQIRGLLATV